MKFKGYEKNNSKLKLDVGVVVAFFSVLICELFFFPFMHFEGFGFHWNFCACDVLLKGEQVPVDGNARFFVLWN